MKTLKEFTNENLNVKELLTTNELSSIIGGDSSICWGGNCTGGACTAGSCTMGSCTAGSCTLGQCIYASNPNINYA